MFPLHSSADLFFDFDTQLQLYRLLLVMMMIMPMIWDGDRIKSGRGSEGDLNLSPYINNMVLIHLARASCSDAISSSVRELKEISGIARYRETKYVFEGVDFKREGIWLI